MSNIFFKGNKITTNKINCLEVVDFNEYQVVCRDLLTNDFSVFFKTEHNFETADVKQVLELSMKEVLDDIEISEKDKQYVLNQLNFRLHSWFK